MAKLTDPWFEARFICEASDNGGYRHEHVDGSAITFAESQGIELWCPCGYGKPEFPLDGGRPHMVMVPFSNPPCGIACPIKFGPESRDKSKPRPRWSVSGTGLSDLSTAPSIAVGTPECWHGYIAAGEVK
jgi:hypothetical protein